MKVVDFLKEFEKLEYDENTELDILLIQRNRMGRFLDIEYVCRNEDCLGYNEIGIVVSDKNEDED